MRELMPSGPHPLLASASRGVLLDVTLKCRANEARE